MKNLKKRFVGIGIIGLLTIGAFGTTVFAAGRGKSVNNTVYRTQCLNNGVCDGTGNDGQCVNNGVCDGTGNGIQCVNSGVCDGTGRYSSTSNGHHYNTSGQCRR